MFLALAVVPAFLSDDAAHNDDIVFSVPDYHELARVVPECRNAQSPEALTVLAEPTLFDASEVRISPGLGREISRFSPSSLRRKV